MMMMITRWIVNLSSDQEFLDSFCVLQLMTLGITWETQMYNNNNVHLSCAHQRPERSHDTYQQYTLLIPVGN